MPKYTKVLQKLQEARLEREAKISNEITARLSDGKFDGGWDSNFDGGFISGINYAEKVLYADQEQLKTNGNHLWRTGNPNDLKANNTGDYVLILKSHFNSDDGIEADHIYISQDYWNGTEWEGFEVGADRWEVLYFAKLKWLYFPLPSELGIKKTDDLFIK